MYEYEQSNTKMKRNFISNTTIKFFYSVYSISTSCFLEKYIFYKGKIVYTFRIIPTILNL